MKDSSSAASTTSAAAFVPSCNLSFNHSFKRKNFLTLVRVLRAPCPSLRHAELIKINKEVRTVEVSASSDSNRLLKSIQYKGSFLQALSMRKYVRVAFERLVYLKSKENVYTSTIISNKLAAKYKVNKCFWECQNAKFTPNSPTTWFR